MSSDTNNDSKKETNKFTGKLFRPVTVAELVKFLQTQNQTALIAVPWYGTTSILVPNASDIRASFCGGDDHPPRQVIKNHLFRELDGLDMGKAADFDDTKHDPTGLVQVPEVILLGHLE